MFFFFKYKFVHEEHGLQNMKCFNKPINCESRANYENNLCYETSSPELSV